MRLQGETSVEQMCQLAQVSRAGFYRYLRGDWQAEEDVMMRSAVQGLVIAQAYPLVAFAPLPKLAATALAACFGPALGMASFGLRRLLDWETPLVSSALGSLLNALAGGLFSAMALVQMAVGYSVGQEKVSAQVNAVWLGLDVAWDAYIGLGTICFALAMLRHPCFGRVFAFPGLAIAAGLLALNFFTFPTPPASAGLVDLGPAVGLCIWLSQSRCGVPSLGHGMSSQFRTDANGEL
jgi:hypothetical protein